MFIIRHLHVLYNLRDKQARVTIGTGNNGTVGGFVERRAIREMIASKVVQIEKVGHTQCLRFDRLTEGRREQPQDLKQVGSKG